MSEKYPHGHESRDPWKRVSQWSQNVSDDGIADLFSTDDEELDTWNLPPVDKSSFTKSFFGGLIGLLLIISAFAAAGYFFARALGFDNFTFRNAVITSVCLCVVRYGDAGVMKQIR